MDNFDNLLARRHRAQHFLTDRAFPHLVDKALGHRERNVSFQESTAHFAQRFVHVFWSEGALASQIVKNGPKPVC